MRDERRAQMLRKKNPFASSIFRYLLLDMPSTNEEVYKQLYRFDPDVSFKHQTYSANWRSTRSRKPRNQPSQYKSLQLLRKNRLKKKRYLASLARLPKT